MSLLKNHILLAVSFLVLLVACQNPVEIEEKLTPEPQPETPVVYDSKLPIDPAHFFSAPIFDTPNDEFWGTLYEEVFPYHVDDLQVWEEGMEPHWNWEEPYEQLKTDYPDFDPLILLKEYPEVLVQNFTTYEGENMLNVETIQRMQVLWEKMDDFDGISELWTPSEASEPISMPEGFPSSYWDNGETYENLFSELIYVDLNGWEETEEEIWKSLYMQESSYYYSDNSLTNFKLLSQEEGFLLLNEISINTSSLGGSFSQESYQLYSYDSFGRFQEGILIKKRAGITYEEPIFTYHQAFYDEEGRLEEFRVSTVNLAANQLSMPRLIYTHERYLAR